MRSSFQHDTNTEWNDVRIKVGIETTGVMPDGFDDAIAELYVPVKRVFAERISKSAQYQAHEAGEEGYTCAIASQTYTTKGSRRSRRGSCTVVVMLFIPATLTAEEVESLEGTLQIDVIDEIISPRLRPVFRRDRRDWQQAERFARQALISGHEEEPEMGEVDETTFEHIEMDRPPRLRVVS